MADREQIEKMAQAMCGFCAVDKLCVLKCCAPCSEVASQDCTCKESAEELIHKGYGKVSEYKAKIEQLNKKLAKCNDLKKLSDWQREEIKILKAEVNKGCDNCETVKQAKIDVLNKVKNCREATDSDCYPYLERIVNKLIKEIENEQKD